MLKILKYSFYDLMRSRWSYVYFAFYFFPTVLLLILSLIFRKNDNGWVKKLDTFGILISIILLFFKGGIISKINVNSRKIHLACTSTQ